MIQRLVRVLREDGGQDLIEYALLAGLISIACVVAIMAVGDAVKTFYETSTTTFVGS